MLKTIKNSVSCESCGSTKVSAIYETYCDECKTLMERGPMYGGKIAYKMFDDDNTKDIESRVRERVFCSYECMLKKMSKERLNGDCWISPDFYLTRKDLKAFLKAVANGIR